MTGSRRWLPVFLFLTAAGALLFRAREFTGWGGGPEAALGALELRPPSAPGYGVVLMAARLFALLPVEGSIFGLSAAAALAGAAGLGFLTVFLIRRGISPGLAALAPLVLLSFPRFWEVCRGFEGAAVFLLFVVVLFLWGGGRSAGSRGFLLFVFAVGLGLTVHPAPVALGVLLVAAGVSPRGLKQWAGGAGRGGIFVLAAAVTPLMFFWLRPALNLNWGGALSAAISGGGGLGYGQWVALVADPTEIKRFAIEFGDAAAGPILPVVLCLPLIFIGRSPKLPVAAILLFLPVYFLVFSLSPYRDAGLTFALATTAICVAGALGLQRLALAAGGGVGGKFLKAAVVCWAIVVLAAPAAKGFSKERFFEPDHSGGFAREVVERLPRDAVLLVRGGGPHSGGPHGGEPRGGEPLLNLAAAQRVEGRRPDVRVVYPMYFSSRGYRDLLREDWGGGLTFPSEGEYARALEDVTAAVIGKDSGMGKVMEERMEEMIEVVVEEAVARENAVFRDVYFSSVGHLVETRQMRGAGFVPEYFAFRLRPRGRAVFDVGRLLKLAESQMRSDPAAARVMGRYFADIGENFYKKRETPRAEEFLMRAVDCDAENVRAYFFLGLIHKEDGRYDEATAELTSAKELLEAKRGGGDLMGTTRVFMLARIYQELGIEVEAEKMFEKIEK